MINANGPLGTPSNNTLVRQYSGSGMTGFFNSTTSITTDQGASISLSFKGTGLYIYGMSGLDGGSAEVTYDGDLTHTLNLTVCLSSLPL